MMGGPKKTGVLMPCTWCGKEIYRVQSKIRERNFCSNQCHKDWDLANIPSKRVHLTCQVCGDDYSVVPAQLKSYNSVACSRKCQGIWQSINRTGENHPNWVERLAQQCAYCEKSFDMPQWKQRLSGNKFCSKECKNNHWTENTLSSESYDEKRTQGNVHYLATNRYRKTIPEKMVEDWLNSHSISNEYQGNINDKFAVDFYLPDHNIIIEVLGDYWHANPRKYGESKNPLSDQQVRQQKRDKSRFAYLKKCGYWVFGVWEYDIRQTIDDAMSEVLKAINTQ